MRPLSGKETKELLDKKPDVFTFALGEMAEDNKVKSKLETLKNDSNFLKVNLDINELVNPFLSRLFPKANFFRVNRIDIKPHIPFLIAIIGNKIYGMSVSFNRLILGHNLEANDKNIIELAKAFVIIALEGQEITFLNVKKSKRTINKKVIYWTNLKVQVKDQKQNYGCRFEKGQIQWATMNIEGETDTRCFDFKILENLPER